MHPKELAIADFQYDLPEDRIAKYPLPERDASRLLEFRDGIITTGSYAELPARLPGNSLLIFNDTKVVEARLLFHKESGGTIEIFCLEPHEQYPDITTAMLQQGKVWWQCLVGGAKKWKAGSLAQSIHSGGKSLTLSATMVERRDETYIIEFNWDDATLSFAELLHLAGLIPLPPYLHRAAEVSDKERYQTIYAQFDGSVAAPTAGLHFTGRLFDALKTKGIISDFVTLHVGAGTFKPVKAATMLEHDMHAEFISIRIELIENILSRLNDPIIPIGTTSLRSVESLYWLGLKTILNPQISPEALHLTQWEPYELPAHTVSAADALQSLLQWMHRHQLKRLLTKTQVIIAPGYRFRIIRALITNFHQPQSTLLLLVAALVGEEWKRIYTYALQHEFRFLSYGDGCLLWNREA